MASFFDRMQASAQPAPRRRRSFFDEMQTLPEVQPEAEDEFGWFDTAVATGLRVVPSVIGSVGGGILGGLAGAPAAGVGAIPGATAGAVAGGAAGGGFGEWLAQEYEKSRGAREGIDPWGIGIEAGLGAIPLGKSATLLRAGAKTAGIGVAGAAAHGLAEEGELPDVGRLALAGGLGGVLGVGGEVAGRRLDARALASKQAAKAAEDEAWLSNMPTHGPEPAQWAPDPASDRRIAAVLQGIQTQSRLSAERAAEREAAESATRAAEHQDIYAHYAQQDAERGEVRDAFSRVIGIGDDQLASDAAADAARSAEADAILTRLSNEGIATAKQRQAERGEVGDAFGRVINIGDDTLAREAADTAERKATLEEVLGIGERRFASDTADTAARNAANDEAWRADMTAAIDELSELDEFKRSLGIDWPATRAEIEEIVQAPDMEGAVRRLRDMQPPTPEQAAARADLFGEVSPEADARRLLEAVRDAGGLSARARDAGGEGAWLSEFRDTDTAGGRPHSGTIGGVGNVIRQNGGKTPDAIIEHLTRELGYSPDEFTTGNLHEKIADAMRTLSGEFRKQRGEVSGELVGMVGGGVAGALAGSAAGDSPEGRAGLAVLGGIAGAGGGAGLARLLRGRAGSRPGLVPSGDSSAPGVPGATEHRVPGAARGVPDTEFGVNADVPRKPATLETPTGTFTSDPQAGTINPKTGKVRRANEREAFRFMGGEIPPVKRMPKDQREELGFHHFPAEQRDTLEELATEFGGLGGREAGLDVLEAQRRYRQPMERTRALAKHMAALTDGKLAPGTNLPAAGHDFYANMLATIQDDFATLGKKIKAEGGTDQELLQLGKLGAARRVAYLNFMGLRSEAGRTLQIYNAFKRVMPHEVAMVRELIDRGRMRKDLVDLTDVAAQLDSDPVKAFQQLQNLEKKGLGEKIADYYMANILSGIKTQERNFLGNASRLVSRVAVKAGTGGLDALSSMLSGSERRVFSKEVLHEAQGAIAGFNKALGDAMETFQLGFSPTAIRESFGPGAIDGPVYLPKVEMGGGLKNPLNYPGRLLESADRFFRQLNGSMELYALTYATARRQAEREGLSGSAFTDRVASLSTGMRLNPSKELKEKIASVAERAVFQEDPGAAVNTLIGLKKQVPQLAYVIPFVRTVSNIFKQGAEHTPLGFIMKRARQSDDLREQTVARGEAAMGTLAVLPIAYYAATGQISGSGPKDSAERARLYESGWRPNSIKIGDRWVSYTLAQPFSIPLSIVANGFEAWREASTNATEKSRIQQAESIAAETIARVGKSALDQSFLSGLGDMVKAINDPERSASGFFARLASGFVPLSGAARNLAQFVDPVVRQPEGVVQTVATGIPGASMLVNPRLDRFGEVAERERHTALLVPEVTAEVRDPVALELARLGLDVGLPTDRVNFSDAGRQLTGDESFDLRQTRGRATRVILGSIMKMPGYQGLPDVLKANLLRRALREGMGDVNDVARVALQGGRPDLLKQISDPLEELAAATYPR